MPPMRDAALAAPAPRRQPVACTQTPATHTCAPSRPACRADLLPGFSAASGATLGTTNATQCAANFYRTNTVQYSTNAATTCTACPDNMQVRPRPQAPLAGSSGTVPPDRHVPRCALGRALPCARQPPTLAPPLDTPPNDTDAARHPGRDLQGRVPGAARLWLVRHQPERDRLPRRPGEAQLRGVAFSSRGRSCRQSALRCALRRSRPPPQPRPLLQPGPRAAP